MKPVGMHRKWAQIQWHGLGLILMFFIIIQPMQTQSLAQLLKGPQEESEIGRDDLSNSEDLYNFISAQLHHSLATDLETLRHSSLPPAWGFSDIPFLEGAERGNNK